MKVRVIGCLSNGWLKQITLDYFWIIAHPHFTTLQKFTERINNALLE